MFGDVWQSEEADPHEEHGAPWLSVGISSWKVRVGGGWGDLCLRANRFTGK